MDNELVDAVLRSDLGAMRDALNGGSDPDGMVDGMTALMHAVFRGDVAAVKLLLENGADPNLAANKSDTPLWHAEDDLEIPEIAALLKEYGAQK